MLSARQTKQLLIVGMLLLALLLSVACWPLLRGEPVATPIAGQTATPGELTPTPTLSATTDGATVTPPPPETTTAEPPTPVVTDTAEPTEPASSPIATTVASLPSTVSYVMALTDLNLRSGPGLAHEVVGWMTSGQIARVTAASSDGGWWQLECPSSSANVCWVAAGSEYTQPQPDATRIAFAPGATSHTINGSMQGTEQVHYVFGADAGQTMTIDVSSPGDSVLFHLQGLLDGHIYKHMLSGELSWHGELAMAQDYVLALNAVGDSTTYTINITTGDRLPTATATSVPDDTPPGGPLFPVVDAETGYLLGGTQNGAWVDAAIYATYLQDTERPYNVYTAAGWQGSVTGSPPLTPEGVCPQPIVPLAPEDNLEGAVALVARWDVAPRLAHDLPANYDLTEYYEAVTDLLQKDGLPDPQAEIDDIQKVDLLGDGVSEVLITASRLTAGTSAPAVAAGDYSLLALRMVVNSEIVTVPLALDTYPQADDLAYPFRYGVLGLLDLNGDGHLEILVEADRYEGRQVTVYEMTPAGVQEVLQAGCVQ